ncbi:FHA domain-containing protein [Arthrobacter sp. ISL-30]|uniref:FHA domain-containing protein n=1 Tax=Arthrobacter sp. ISL-30 TaxID=2819109 RepID=UPI001BED295B|nr:FHA domain-containing protein [Arthrobacter sp. ISL-30]MBT2514097.1 hypothetical protein [Arthrobacter sp. ISL-30]
MAISRYAPGTWFGIIRSGTIVLLAPETREELVAALWDFLEYEPEAHEVLHEVTQGFGVSLSRIPPFGIIDSRDPLRVFLRGGLELEVHGASGKETISGRDITTWNERRITGAEWFGLRISDASLIPGLSAPAVQALPLAEGVVMLSGFALSIGAGLSIEAGLAKGAGFAKAATRPLESFAPAVAPPERRHPGIESEVSASEVSAETVMAFHDDLDMTIAPGLSPESSEGAQAAEAAEAAGGPGAAGGIGASEGVQAFQISEPEAQSAAGAVRTAPNEQAATPAQEEFTSSYDHLWDKTVIRNIEDAAIRVDPDAEADHEEVAAQEKGSAHEKTPAHEEDSAGEVVVDAASTSAPAGPHPEKPGDEPKEPLAQSNEPSVKSTEAPSTRRFEVPSGLIDSVPWSRSERPAQPLRQTQPLVPNRSQPTNQPLSSNQSSPPVAEVPGTDNGGAGREQDNLAEAATIDGDHDGQTVMKSSLSGLGQPKSDESKAEEGKAEEDRALGNASGPKVLARVCTQGHTNPPTYAVCSSCGLPLAGDAIQAPRPRLGRMRVSTGEVVDLDQSLIIGRQPSVACVQGGAMPRLVQVASPGGDISRSHVEVRLEGWHVMLCDLKATNGTVLVREGQAPRRLAQSEMAILLDGDIAELGDGVSLRFEEIP